MSSYLKVKPYRNPQLLKLAKNAPCATKKWYNKQNP